MSETTTAATSGTFSKYAQVYDADRRPLIPGYDEFYGVGLRLIADEAQGRPLRVLDLGAGTGLFSGMAMEALNISALHLVDASAAMLDGARKRFAGDARVSYALDDLVTMDLGSGWDAVISALAIHHLENSDKRALYARIARALVPGGRFVNAEQVAAPSAAEEARYVRFWKADVQARGVDDAGLAASLDRQRHDRCAPVGTQLDWLREAGFAEVDCPFKLWRFAVLTGRV
ncbi:MAG: class I SAM-dependent methyltransferase [Rhodobacterales bacterium]|nr:class I SAM-dependent methyltransferase [Rhodobacterales bacterium]MDX5500712.1 class I SAM-dependent methyltransferase [Rhodobacterales bacterium]